MSQSINRKRKQSNDDVGRRRKHVSSKKRKRAAAAYHSSSEDEDENKEHNSLDGVTYTADDVEFSSSADEDGGGVDLPNLVQDTTKKPQPDGDVDEDEPGSSEEAEENEAGDDDDDSDAASSNAPRKIPKRNDPSHFATSISKILSSKLTTSKRADPVLSRSKDASKTAKELNEGKLEAKAKRKLREEKRAALERAREKDVTGVSREDVSAGAVAEKEKQLRKTAQRGVVKLFNAVRAAQAKGEETAQAAREKGVVGVDRRQEQVNEMSKKGFLDLLVEGGR